MANSADLLPNHLVDKTLVRLLFPNFLQTGMLATSHNNQFVGKPEARTTSGTLHGTENSEPPGSLSSREDITYVSTRWSIFVPFFCPDHAMMGYDPQSRRWHRFFLHSSLPRPVSARKEHGRFVASGGCLLTTLDFSRSPESQLRVANPLTGSWVELKVPPVPKAARSDRNCRSIMKNVLIVIRGCIDYKILLLYSLNSGGDSSHFIVQEFDSLKHKWRTLCYQSSVQWSSHYLVEGSSLVVGDNVYFLSISSTNFLAAWRFETTTEKLRSKHLPIHRRLFLESIGAACLHSWNSRVKLILLQALPLRTTKLLQFSVIVCSIDSETLELDGGDRSKSPPTDFGGGFYPDHPPTIKTVSHEGLVFFYVSKTPYAVLHSVWSYSISGRTWTLLPDTPVTLKMFSNLEWVSGAPQLLPS